MKNLRSFNAIEDRRAYIESVVSVKLPGIATASVAGINQDVRVENLIGAVSVPLGVAGPLKIAGEYTEGEYVIPLATTEAALVASVNRGCKAVYSSGVNVRVRNVGTTRGPVFYVGSIKNNKKLYQWMDNHEQEIAKVAEATSSHLKYKKMKIAGTADYLFVNFYYDTDDAMGMNMVTIATQAVVEFITKETGYACVTVAGNYDVDKKPAWMNFTNNRGYKVWADATISKEILANVLKTTADEIYDVWISKCMIGSAMSGSMGFNAHYANIVAALYIATGQDAAHVVEGSMGITTTKVLQGGDLYLGVYMPAVMVGTVGGGTKIQTQSEALSILGVKKASELAEIVGGSVLAGELSLLASLAAGTLACSHENLARGDK